MATTPLKSQLNSMLGDEMKRLEMDVTNSFLNGKICSPLMATATNTLQSANVAKSSALNAAAAAGLYITKDGLQFDPAAASSVVQSILNVAIDTTKAELLNIRNRAWKELTYIPDPSIIVKRATSYFTYFLTNEFKAEDILDFTSADEKVEKIQNEQPNRTMKSVEDFINKHLPKINDKITTATDTITEYCTYATYYASFGPEWLTDKISYGIDSAMLSVNKDVSEFTDYVNNYKMEMYNNVGDRLGQEMAKQYETLVRQQAQTLNAEIETKKKAALSKSRSLMYKANMKIYELTGINLPLDILKPENLSKLKTAQKLAKLANIASAGSSSENSTAPVGKPGDETSTNVSNTNNMYEQYAGPQLKDNYLNQVRTIVSRFEGEKNRLIDICADESVMKMINDKITRAQTIENEITNYLDNGKDVFNGDVEYKNLNDLMKAMVLLINTYFDEHINEFGLDPDNFNNFNNNELPLVEQPKVYTI